MILQIVINSLVNGSVYAVVAFGFTLMYSTMNFFNMGYGINVMVGAYAFYVFYIVCSMPIVVCVLLAFAITAALMVAVDRICYHNLRSKRVPAWSFVAISMSVAVIFQSLASVVFGNKVIPLREGVPETYRFFDATITPIQIVTVSAAIIIVIVITAYMQMTKTGKIIRAVSNDRQMAMVVGVEVERIFIAVIIVSSILATSAGILMSLDTGVSPNISNSALLKAIVASIVGGVGNVKGSLFAGLLIAFLESIGTVFIGSGWRDAIPLIIIILLMVAKPSYFGAATNK